MQFVHVLNKQVNTLLIVQIIYTLYLKITENRNIFVKKTSDLRWNNIIGDSTNLDVPIMRYPSSILRVDSYYTVNQCLEIDECLKTHYFLKTLWINHSTIQCIKSITVKEDSHSWCGTVTILNYLVKAYFFSGLY